MNSFNFHIDQVPDSDKCYMRQHFEVTGFMNSSEDRSDSNIISRMRNLMVGSIWDQITFPKFIFVVADDNIIESCFTSEEPSISQNLGKLIDWLMCEYDKLVTMQKNYLPIKAKKPNYPTFIWIEAPLHKSFRNNEARGRYNRAFYTPWQNYTIMLVLQLKKLWDPKDGSLFTMSENKFTVGGYTTYWNAVDKTAKFADTILFKKSLKSKYVESQKSVKNTHVESRHHHRSQSSDHFHDSHRNDRYHWTTSHRQNHSRQLLRDEHHNQVGPRWSKRTFNRF